MIRSGYQPRNRTDDGERIIDVSDALKKLYDHVNLDIARISYSDAGDRKISGEEAVSELQTQVWAYLLQWCLPLQAVLHFPHPF